jgi:hypothetical protein
MGKATRIKSPKRKRDFSRVNERFTEEDEMAAKGQSTRDKFFLDFVATATQSSDPFGKARQKANHTEVTELGLPSLFIFDSGCNTGSEPVAVTAESKAMYQSTNAFNVDSRIGEIKSVADKMQPDFRSNG